MTYAQTHRLYRLLFGIVATIVAIFTYLPVAEWWDDVLGDELRERHRAKIRQYVHDEYNRILAEEGKEAAQAYQRLPKVSGKSNAMRHYENWRWALVVTTIMAIAAGAYYLIWGAGNWCFRYVVHGPKAEQAHGEQRLTRPESKDES